MRVFWIMGLILAVLGTGWAQGPAGPEVRPTPHSVAMTSPATPGVALSQELTEITGVAISPLLGVSAVGSWRWFRAAPGERASLAWYCQPWAWGTGLAILALCFVKDTLGTTVPGVLKKPLDFVELLENKASALIAGGAFIPLVALEAARNMQAPSVPGAIAGVEVAAFLDPAVITVPLAMLYFAVVWTLGHAFNVLIILSPFSMVDAMLKLARLSLLVGLGLAYAIAPWLGGLVSVLILGMALLLLPITLRLLIFGSLFSWDMLRLLWGRHRVEIERARAFVFSPVLGIPRLSGGRLSKNEQGGLEFHCRKFGIGPRRVVPVDGERVEIAKGLVMPRIIRTCGGRSERVLVLLPSYRGREEEMREYFGMDGVRDHVWASGWRAAKAWLITLCTRRGRGEIRTGGACE